MSEISDLLAFHRLRDEQRARRDERDRSVQYELQNFRASLLRFIPLLTTGEMLQLRDALAEAAVQIDARTIAAAPVDENIPHAATGEACW